SKNSAWKSLGAFFASAAMQDAAGPQARGFACTVPSTGMTARRARRHNAAMTTLPSTAGAAPAP
ncbi:MAG: hypothetical protein ABN502_18040, partial [Gammaproteobacteria bacterium]